MLTSACLFYGIRRGLNLYCQMVVPLGWTRSLASALPPPDNPPPNVRRS